MDHVIFHGAVEVGGRVSVLRNDGAVFVGELAVLDADRVVVNGHEVVARRVVALRPA